MTDVAERLRLRLVAEENASQLRGGRHSSERHVGVRNVVLARREGIVRASASNFGPVAPISR